MNDTVRLLLVRSDDPFRRSFLRALPETVEVESVGTLEEARETLRGGRFDAVAGDSAVLESLVSSGGSVPAFALTSDLPPGLQADRLAEVLRTPRLARENRRLAEQVGRSTQDLSDILRSRSGPGLPDWAARIRVRLVDEEGFERRLREALPSGAPEWILDAGEANPGLVLFGLPLSTPDGVERLRSLRASLPRTVPIVVLVDDEDAEVVDRAYALGANSVVGRPASASALARFVRAAALLWRPPR